MLLAGLALSTLAMLQIGYAKSLANLIFSDVGTQEVATRVLAISAIFAIDFSINAGENLHTPYLDSLSVSKWAQ